MKSNPKIVEIYRLLPVSKLASLYCYKTDQISKLLLASKNIPEQEWMEILEEDLVNIRTAIETLD